MDYHDFIDQKRRTISESGFAYDGELHESLFDFQADVVRWSLRIGRSAVFLDCGLGKARIALEWARVVSETTQRRVLILAPLAVNHQFGVEAASIGVTVTQCKTAEDVRAGINITNYERLHHFDDCDFGAVVLDESSILKAHDGKTRSYLIERFRDTPFKMCCTATPSPNDHMELGNHAEFLGWMSESEMLSMFFVHDGGQTQKWRLKGHAEQDFWAWVCSWSVYMRQPADLGYIGSEGFELPPLNIHDHVLENSADFMKARGYLFDPGARTLNDQRAARRDSQAVRVALAAEMANASDEPWLIWCDLNTESEALKKAIPDAVQVTGSDSLEHKEASMVGFTEGRIRVLVTKPKIAGFGMNWQHCHNTAFVGVSHSWEAWYQAIRRIYRFGQKTPVDCHLITSEGEGRVIDNLKRKQRAAEEMAAGMIANTQELTRQQLVKDQLAASKEYTPDKAMELPSWIPTKADIDCDGQHIDPKWAMYNGDSVEMIKALDDDSIHYSVYSPPFADLYVYSNNERDMGNCSNPAEFMEHFGFLIRELLRVTMPGRLTSFHCMNLPSSKTRDGVIGLKDFRGALIRAFVDAGWIYHSEVCIWKDPVTAMQRTKALGLLHKQIRKDSCMSRMGIPDYLVTMRAPGENPERVGHTAEEFPVKKWQNYASPIWMDINPSDTIQFRSAREHEDERHICPLQLEVIRRGIDLWTNPGDIVLSPFAGIGSEIYCAVEADRRGIGFELKPSYYRQAVKNIAGAKKQQDMFGQ